MGKRRKSRELALQVLYGHDLQELSCDRQVVEQALAEFRDSFEAGERAMEYARAIVLGICAHREAIDRLLTRHAHNWRLERMSAVDRNILRIAAWEILHGPDVPVQVAINEALEVAKRFSTADACPFINGILDSLKDDKAV